MARVPVIIGVADIKNKSRKIENAKEPSQLMLEAINAAIQDTQLQGPASEKLKSSIDSLSVVRTWTWPYKDLPGLLSKRMGVSPKHKHYTPTGGDQPVKILDEEAIRVASGESRVSVITGGESLASLGACAKMGKIPPPGWTTPEKGAGGFDLTELINGDDLGGIHSFGLPIHVYPLYENGFRAYRRQSPEENNKESALLYSSFSEIAVRNQYAWNFGNQPETADSIAKVTKKNRIICLPYPLLMNAFNSVNLAAACIITSTDFATELGIQESKWVYPLGGAGATDSDKVWLRPNYFSSPAISKSLDICLASSGVKTEEIDIFDFYSCFPIVPKLACHHLGLSILDSAKPITLLGGLTSFGGAGNNYSMHAITEMTRQLRLKRENELESKGHTGLILANGGVLTYQHAICLSSSQPRRHVYPDNQNQTTESDTRTLSPPAITDVAEGEAVIETYTVEFSRTGQPSKAYIIGRLTGTGNRFVANHGNTATLHTLSSPLEEQIGKKGYVTSEEVNGTDKRRNLFFLGPKTVL